MAIGLCRHFKAKIGCGGRFEAPKSPMEKIRTVGEERAHAGCRERYLMSRRQNSQAATRRKAWKKKNRGKGLKKETSTNLNHFADVWQRTTHPPPQRKKQQMLKPGCQEKVGSAAPNQKTAADDTNQVQKNSL